MSTTTKAISRRELVRADRQERSIGRASFGKTGHQHVRLITFLIEKDLWWNIPDRQRGEVWPLWKRQLFLDTLLRGPDFMNLNSVFFNQEWITTEEGGEKLIYTAEDGRQRMSAIYDFLEGRLKTFNVTEYIKHVLIDGLDPMPFDKTYNDLSERMKQEFLNYPLPVTVAENVHPLIAGERFRRRNLGIQISPGEDLRSYHPTAATILAEKISAHPLWTGMFTDKKRKDRKYRFEMALYILLMTVKGFPSQMNRNDLKRVAAGKYDSLFTAEREAEIMTRCDQLQHVLAGAVIPAKTYAIMLWQMGEYLAKAGCDFLASEPSCLVGWYENSKNLRISGIKFGNLNLLAQMTHQDIQKKFWNHQKTVLLDQPGLVFPDRKKWEDVRNSEELVVPQPALNVKFDQNGLVITASDRLPE